ncbi:MAG: glycosyltransferase family 9 protein [Desulfovibrionaceae bacterium]|nr:glycosyltransferase family 9 protein [Desulfovibrionaceae bacterium]
MRKFLVLQLARLGDLLQSKRLVFSLMKEGETHLAVDFSLASLASLIYPQAVIHALPAHAGNLREAETLALAREACASFVAAGFERVYNLNRSSLNLVLAGLFEPERVSGYRLDRGQPLASTWSKMGARWTRKRRASPLNLMDFWAFFHPSPLPPELVNPVAGSGRAAGASGQAVGVVMAGQAARRSLPPAILVRILEALFAALKGPEFIFLGSRTEAGIARRLLGSLPGKIQGKTRDLTGRTSLEDLPEVLGGLDLLLAPDTGLMHLAAHLGVPVMAFFLSSAWAWETGPYGLGHLVWQAVNPCSPCLENAPCSQDLACLRGLKEAEWPGLLSGIGAENYDPRESGGLSLLRSGLDHLGAVYHGPDPEREERTAARSLLAEFLNLAPPAGLSIPEHVSAGLLAENDWLLPEYLEIL